MVASKTFAFMALLFLGVGAVVLREPDRPLQIQHPAGRLPPLGTSVQSEKLQKPVVAILSNTRPVRAGLFAFPSMDIGDLAAGSLAPLTVPVSLRTDVGEDPTFPGFDDEIPGDPLHDALKARMVDWPVSNMPAKDNLLVSRYPTGLAPSPEDALLNAPFEASMEPDASDSAEPVLAIPDPVVELPPPVDTLANSEGTVPLSLTGAPSGGLSPSLSHPGLAEIDTRITVENDAMPVEIAIANGHSVEAPLTLASAPAEPLPLISSQDGVTTASKNLSLRGLDDGVARPMLMPPVAYTKAQTCLATAIYFEARGESEKGQIGVAQVIVNRVRSPYYPKDVCSVVYQNASHRNACQFSFACDGHADRVRDLESWTQALTLAQKVLDAEAWLPDVGNATHYHADYVRPRWVRDMVQKDRIGRHIFYRVRWWT